MHHRLHLACVLVFDQPSGAAASAMDRRFAQGIEPIVAAMESDERLSFVLHISGRLLEFAANRRPKLLGRMAALVAQGRLELLGGGYYSPVLSSIPERDAIGQLQHMTNWLSRNLDSRPAGCWLALRSWDPGLPRVLAQAGMRYTLVDDAQFFGAGLQPGLVHGHFSTHRTGHSVSVFPIDRRLTQVVETAVPSRVLDLLSRANAAHQTEGERLAVLAMDGDRFVATGRFGDLVDHLDHQHHWLKSTTLARSFETQPTRGLVNLLQGADPDLAEWACTAEARERRRYLHFRLEQAHSWGLVRYHVDRVLFDNFLIKYREANHLHKRMLATSNNVDRLRTILAERQRTGRVSESDVRARRVLEKACDLLWRAQSHGVYWHRGRGLAGVYDPRLRISVTRQLMSAVRTVEAALGDPARNGWWDQRIDYDSDGAEEALVKSPHLSAVVHAAAGGVLWELDLRERGIPLLTALSPVEEPYDDELVGNEVVLVDSELSVEPDRIPKTNPGARLPTREMERRRVDRLQRGAFQDHFLGPETTLQTFAVRQFRDVGDFAGKRYELARIAGPENPHQPYGVAHVVRSGVVKDVDKTLLLRVEKEYRFDPNRARMVVHHTISNRSRDTATFWHGLEWTFGIPSGEELNLWATAFEGNRERTYQLIDGPQDLGEITWLEIKDTELDLAVVIEVPEPVRAWWTPVTSVYETAEGWVETVQGQTLLLHRELEVWGEDSQSMQVGIDFLFG